MSAVVLPNGQREQPDDSPPGGRRGEASGLGWKEHFVDSRRASTTISVGQALSKSYSYVTIANFATLDERSALIESACAVQCSAKKAGDDEKTGSETGSNHILFASESNFNCNRYSVETLLDDGARATSSAFLGRLCGFLEEGNCSNRGFVGSRGGEEMSDLARHVFGTSSDLDKMKAVWYAEPDEHGKLHPEPKVNLYSEGGYFKQHGDGMALTLLVVLSDEFEGGGTAFYRDLDLSHQDLKGREEEKMSNDDHNMDPESIAKPPAGTAIIWGATLQHMALPVTKGKRAVYVGSFDLKEDDK